MSKLSKQALLCDKKARAAQEALEPAKESTVVTKVSNLVNTQQSLARGKRNKVARGTLYRLLNKLTLWLCGMVLLLQGISTAAWGALAVFDSSLLAEQMRQRALMVQQWAYDNEQQISQVQELFTANKQLLTTYNLMEQNYTMDNQSSWKDIARLQEQSLALLYASKSLWGEYGSAQRYYADQLKAQAWENCMATHNCNFNVAMQEMNNLNMSHALQAYDNAEKVSDMLDQQIGSLQRITVEGLNSQSLAATVDAMAKLTGSVAESMVDLNQQVALFTRMIGQDLSKESQTENINRQYREIIMEYSPMYQDPIKSKLQ